MPTYFLKSIFYGQSDRPLIGEIENNHNSSKETIGYYDCRKVYIISDGRSKFSTNNKSFLDP